MAECGAWALYRGPKLRHTTGPIACWCAIVSRKVMTSEFSPSEISSIYRVIAERRDVRHFVSTPVDEAILSRVLTAAHHAPSVGLMQPWRFIRIKSRLVRDQICALVDEERHLTAAALGERGNEFMRLKVEGIKQCGEVMAVALMDKREGPIFGRRTMPDVNLASVACAVQNMWLASRAEGIGMG